MGELPASLAKALRDQYACNYEDTSRKVRMNFEDMDFANAMERDEMEHLVEEIEQLCRDCKAEANGLSFS